MDRKAPSHIVTALKNYDLSLRLRFSLQRKTWILERKCEPCFLRKPVKYVSDGNGGEHEVWLSIDSDAYIQYHDGYTDIRLAIPFPFPSEQAFMEILYRSDTARRGKQFIRDLEDQYEKNEQKKEVEQNARIHERSMEAWNDIHMAGSRELGSMKRFKTR